MVPFSNGMLEEVGCEPSSSIVRVDRDSMKLHFIEETLSQAKPDDVLVFVHDEMMAVGRLYGVFEAGQGPPTRFG